MDKHRLASPSVVIWSAAWQLNLKVMFESTPLLSYDLFPKMMCILASLSNELIDEGVKDRIGRTQVAAHLST